MMKKREIGTRFSWLRTYCVIVALMSLCFLIGTGIIFLNLEKNIRQFTNSQARISKNILEAEWENAYTYGIQLFYDYDVKNMEKADLRILENRKTAYHTSVSMWNHIAANPIIEDFYLYYPQSDYVIGSRGVYDVDVYGALLHMSNRDWDAQTWKNVIFQRDVGFFLVAEDDRLSLYYRLATTTDSGRILVAKLNTSEVTKVLEWVSGAQSNSLMAIVYDDMRIYSYAGDIDGLIDTEANYLNTIDESKFFYADFTSVLTPLHYISVTEISAACQAAETVSWISVICILFSSVGALLLSNYFTNRNMLPLLRLIERYGKQNHDHKDEMQELELLIDELSHESQEALISIAQQKHRLVVSAFLNECFNLHAASQQTVTNLAAIYDLSFENTNYVLIVQERTNEYHSKDIMDLLENWDNDAAAIYWTQQNDLDVFLINFDLDDDGNVPYRAFLEQLQPYFDNPKSTAISTQTDNLEEIRSCWLECLHQLKKDSISAGGTTEETISFQGHVLYNSFVKYLQDEAFSGAINLVPQLCENYLNCGSALERECKRYRIIRQLLTVNNAQRYERSLQALATEPLDADWGTLLCKVLSQMHRVHLIDELPLSEYSTAARIRLFIDEEYHNPSIDLRMVSEYVGLSQSYVSRIFKNEYQIGISQYLNFVRISHAKQWLQTDTLSIKAIALQVGYASDAHFIRIFKKLEGKTPGAYRYESIGNNS